MLKRKIQFLILFFILFGTMFNSLARDLNPEKILIVTDRKYYLAGEDVMLQLFRDPADKCGVQSGFVSVDLISAGKRIVLSEKFRIEGESCQLVLKVPDDIETGNYLVRIYTAYNRNFGPSAYSYSVLCIINPEEEIIIQTGKRSLPEVACKRSGEGFDYYFYFHDFSTLQAKNDIFILYNDSFRIKLDTVYESGLARCWLKNEIERTNFQLCDNNGDTIFSMITPPVPSFFVRQYKSRFDRHFNLKSFGSGDEKGKLVLKTVTGNTLFQQDYNYGEEIYFTVSNDSLSNGFYILDIIDRNEKLSGRLSFYIDRFPADFQPGLSIYGLANPGGRVEVDITGTANSELNACVSACPVSIQAFSKENIIELGLSFPILLDNLLFECPPDYFKDEDEKEIFIKLVCNQLNRGSFFEKEGREEQYYPETIDPLIQGRLRGEDSLFSVSDKLLFLTLKGESNYLLTGKTNGKGDFVFPYIYGGEEMDLAISMDKETSGNASLMIINPVDHEIPDFRLPGTMIDSSVVRALEQLFIRNQLGNPYFRFDRKERLVFPSLIEASVDYKVKPEEYIDLPDLESVFHEIIPTVRIIKDIGESKLIITDPETGTFDADPLVLLDYTPVPDIEALLKISPKGIRSVNTIPGSFIISGQLYKGLILVDTKLNDYAGFDFKGNTYFFSLDYPVRTGKFTPVDTKNDILFYTTFLFQEIERPEKLNFILPGYDDIFNISIRGINDDGLIVKTDCKINSFFQ